MQQVQQHPLMLVHDGEGLSADAAAWAMVADAAERAINLPGLSAACVQELREMQSACLYAGPARPQREFAP